MRLPSTASVGCTSFSSPVFSTSQHSVLGDQWTGGEREKTNDQNKRHSKSGGQKGQRDLCERDSRVKFRIWAGQLSVFGCTRRGFGVVPSSVVSYQCYVAARWGIAENYSKYFITTCRTRGLNSGRFFPISTPDTCRRPINCPINLLLECLGGSKDLCLLILCLIAFGHFWGLFLEENWLWPVPCTLSFRP